MIENNSKQKDFAWVWPRAGGTSTHEGLDSEIFDTDNFPHAATFVREAIQNVLDARKDKNSPAKLSFRFCAGSSVEINACLNSLFENRLKCGLPLPSGDASWLVVEDQNTTGLKGDLGKRGSDFWSYWLNFGRSNKSGEGRGGRGIGRVTFLLASEIQAVLGFTRRDGDAYPVCCGMSVLKSGNFEPEDQAEKWRDSRAIFAGKEVGDIFQLHPAEEVADALSELNMSSYAGPHQTGLSLAIPFPRKELTVDRIFAAAIENFAPAIADGQLVLDVDGTTVGSADLKERAFEVKSEFRSEGFRDDPKGVVKILSSGEPIADFHLQMDEAVNGSSSLADGELRAKIRDAFDNLSDDEAITIVITVSLKRKDVSHSGQLYVLLRPTPPGNKSVDMFYRGGMLLPDVKTSNKAEIDTFIFTKDDELNTYLNFCEGKAHLDLLGNTEVKNNLAEHGFNNNLRLKNFVKNLPKSLRSLVQPDSSRPDSTVFAKWFSVPNAPKEGKKKKRKKVIIPSPPEPKERYFLVTQKKDGFEVRANPNAKGWPINLRVRVAYADGRAKPKWSPYDFRIRDLDLVVSGCASQKTVEQDGKNGVKGSEAGLNFLDCNSDFVAAFSGFDVKRELIVRHTPYKSRSVQND